MRSLEFWILAYLLNSLWQVPLLFAAGWLAARALRSIGAAAQHRVWVLVLLLQSLLPAFSIFSWDWLRTFSVWEWHASRAGEAQVSVVMGAGTAIGLLQFPGMLLTTIAILYAAVIAYFAARFLWRGRNPLRHQARSRNGSLPGKVHFSGHDARAGLRWKMYPLRPRPESFRP